MSLGESDGFFLIFTFFARALQQIAPVHSVRQCASVHFSPKHKLHLKKSMQILLVMNILGNGDISVKILQNTAQTSVWIANRIHKR